MAYVHKQDSPAATWSVVHNLGREPISDVMVKNPSGQLEKILPKSVVHVDSTKLQINFTVPFSGVARLI